MEEPANLADAIKGNPLTVIVNPRPAPDAGVFVIAGATSSEESAQGALPNALKDTIEQLGKARGDQAFLSPVEIAHYVGQRLAFQNTVFRAAADQLDLPTIVPNPWHGAGTLQDQAELPSWAFVGTAGGVGKTTLAMLTAELIAQTGRSVLYVDIDFATAYATSKWCERANVRVSPHR